jgi:transposase
MKAYSMDLRRRVVAACDEGGATREPIAARFSVSVSWIRDLMRRRRDTGSIAPKPHGGGRPPAFAGASAERLRAAVAADDDATLAELAEAAGVACVPSAVHGALVRLGITRKKSRAGRPSRTGPS